MTSSIYLGMQFPNLRWMDCADKFPLWGESIVFALSGIANSRYQKYTGKLTDCTRTINQNKRLRQLQIRVEIKEATWL